MSISSIRSFFGCCRAKTGQARVDRDLFFTNQVIRVVRAAEKLGTRIGIPWRSAYLGLGALASRTNLLTCAAILVGVGIGEYFLAYKNNTHPFSIKSHRSFRDNLSAFEDQLMDHLDNTNRRSALLALDRLESQFDTLPDDEKPLDQKFKLDAMREFITKDEITGFEKLFFLKVWKNGFSKNSAIWKSLVNYYRTNGINSNTSRMFTFWAKNWRKPFNCLPRDNNIYTPDLTVTNFLCYFDTFLDRIMHDKERYRSDHDLQQLSFHLNIMAQFLNFYKDHKQHLFFSGKFFESYLSKAATKILSTYQQILRERESEVVPVNIGLVVVMSLAGLAGVD